MPTGSARGGRCSRGCCRGPDQDLVAAEALRRILAGYWADVRSCGYSSGVRPGSAAVRESGARRAHSARPRAFHSRPPLASCPASSIKAVSPSLFGLLGQPQRLLGVLSKRAPSEIDASWPWTSCVDSPSPPACTDLLRLSVQNCSWRRTVDNFRERADVHKVVSSIGRSRADIRL